MPPPQALIDSLVNGPSIVTAVQWFDTCDSTNAVAGRDAAEGAPAGLLVLADEQTAGRGRHGRSWQAPPGSSLLLSLLVRPTVPASAIGLLPLLAGLVLAETVARHLPDAEVALKWPNDVLLGEQKAAGILAEASGDAVVVGMGVNIDWRGVQRPEELATATSLAEAAGHDIDRWRVLAGVIGMFSQRYDQWLQLPAGFLAGYRQRCATIGRSVAVERTSQSTLTGIAAGVDADGSLLVRIGSGTTLPVRAGDVEHLRPA